MTRVHFMPLGGSNSTVLIERSIKLLDSLHPYAPVSPTCLCRILLVDDLPDNLFLLQFFLEAEGYSVELADNGVTALKKMQASPPNLVLLDIHMPEMNGYEVLQRARQDEKLCCVPILLITADVEEGELAGRRLGANSFLRKPIDFQVLLAQIQQFCCL